MRFLLNIREKRCEGLQLQAFTVAREAKGRCEGLQLQAFTVAREAKGRCEGLETQAFTLFRTENQGLTLMM